MQFSPFNSIGIPSQMSIRGRQVVKKGQNLVNVVKECPLSQIVNLSRHKYTHSSSHWERYKHNTSFIMQLTAISYIGWQVTFQRKKQKSFLTKMHCSVIIRRNPIEANANTGEIQLPGNPSAPTWKSFSHYRKSFSHYR